MYIHIGGEKIIRTRELIAIYDLSIEKSSKISQQFVQDAIRNQRMEKIGDEDPKSLVVTEDKLYYSPISSNTLKKRAAHLAIH